MSAGVSPCACVLLPVCGQRSSALARMCSTSWPGDDDPTLVGDDQVGRPDGSAAAGGQHGDSAEGGLGCASKRRSSRENGKAQPLYGA
jgi:hypothetical protein